MDGNYKSSSVANAVAASEPTAPWEGTAQRERAFATQTGRALCAVAAGSSGCGRARRGEVRNVYGEFHIAVHDVGHKL